MTRRRLVALLDEHRAALAACRRCGYEDPAVLPIISPARAPRVMLVGQAPGKSELGDRRPFAGRAGQTLFRWLARAGIDEESAREQIYIAAITRCYPGPSPGGRGDRVPSPREQRLCGEWLDRELALIRPALIIPVGRLAINRFIGSRPLDRLIGEAHLVQHSGGVARAIPLPHPSGASSWTNEPAHRTLLERALAVLGRELAALGINRPAASARRSA